jgi:hypothetical protein
LAAAEFTPSQRTKENAQLLWLLLDLRLHKGQRKTRSCMVAAEFTTAQKTKEYAQLLWLLLDLRLHKGQRKMRSCFGCC